MVLWVGQAQLCGSGAHCLMKRLSDSARDGPAGNRVTEVLETPSIPALRAPPCKVTVELIWALELTRWRRQWEGQEMQSRFQSSLENQPSLTRPELNVAYSTMSQKSTQKKREERALTHRIMRSPSRPHWKRERTQSRRWCGHLWKTQLATVTCFPSIQM